MSDKTQLQQLLKLAKAAHIKFREPMPIMNCVKFYNHTAMVSDFNTTIQISVHTAFSGAIEVDILLAAMLQEDPEIADTPTENSLIKVGAVSIPYTSVEEYPKVTPPETDNFRSYALINSGNLEQCLKFASKDESRFNLHGIYLNVPASEMVGCDGHRIALAPLVATQTETKPYILPYNFCKALIQLAGKSLDNLLIHHCEATGKIKVNGAGITIYASRVDGEYPDYSQVLKSQATSNSQIVKILDLKKFKSIVHDATKWTKEYTDPCMVFDGDKLEILCPNKGNLPFSLAALTSPFPHKLGLNPRYLYDALASEVSEIQVPSKSDSPILLTSKNGVRSIIMPMRA